MMQRTIFLSMVSGEFRSYRELLTNDLQRCQVAVETQEQWGTLGLTTLEKLDHFIQKLKPDAGAVVHVVGDRLGYVPGKAAVDALLARHPGFLPYMSEHTGLSREQLAECSYTQWEALLALFHDDSDGSRPAEAQRRGTVRPREGNGSVG